MKCYVGVTAYIHLMIEIVIQLTKIIMHVTDSLPNLEVDEINS